MSGKETVPPPSPSSSLHQSTEEKFTKHSKEIFQKLRRLSYIVFSYVRNVKNPPAWSGPTRLRSLQKKVGGGSRGESLLFLILLFFPFLCVTLRNKKPSSSSSSNGSKQGREKGPPGRKQRYRARKEFRIKKGHFTLSDMWVE